MVICNAGLCTGLDSPALINEFTKFGAVHDYYLPRNKSYCFVTCVSVSDAINIYNNTNSQCRLGQNETVIYMIYCESGIITIADSLKKGVAHQNPTKLKLLFKITHSTGSRIKRSHIAAVTTGIDHIERLYK